MRAQASIVCPQCGRSSNGSSPRWCGACGAQLPPVRKKRRAHRWIAYTAGGLLALVIVAEIIGPAPDKPGLATKHSGHSSQLAPVAPASPETDE
jgi:ribosomal protein L37E